MVKIHDPHTAALVREVAERFRSELEEITRLPWSVNFKEDPIYFVPGQPRFEILLEERDVEDVKAAERRLIEGNGFDA